MDFVRIMRPIPRPPASILHAQIAASNRFRVDAGSGGQLDVDRGHVRRMVQLTFLPPRFVEAALAGEDVGSLAVLMRSQSLAWR